VVMLFKSHKALAYLLRHGYVYTIRAKKRPEGKDWVTNKRGGKKIANVFVKYVGVVRIEETGSIVLTKCGVRLLEEYVRKSGFWDEQEWLEEVRKLNGTLPDKAHLYFVCLADSIAEFGESLIIEGLLQ